MSRSGFRMGRSCLMGLLIAVAGCGTSVDPAVKEAKDAGHEACDRYLDCVLEVTPEIVGPTLMAYGPEGECFNTEDLGVIDICTRACAQGRKGLGELYTDIGACGECQNDEHCAEAEHKNRCDVKSNECVTCLVDGDCAEGVCHPTLHACVRCADDGDCPDGACDPGSNTCVGCLTDEHCPGGACDVEANNCVGCRTDEHCPGGVCDVEAQTCVACLADADCDGGRCDVPAAKCVGCLDEGDCTDLEDCMNQQCIVHDTICTPGHRRCDGEKSYELCASDGLVWEAGGSCAGGKVCDPETALCVNPMICPDGATDCSFANGDVAVFICYNGGTQIKKDEDCDGAGKTCFEGACVNTTYGPCESATDTCAVGSDVCTLGAQNDFYCAEKAVCVTDADCPPGYPEGADYVPECDFGVCRLRCEPGVCPPGMACRADKPGEGVCVWKY